MDPQDPLGSARQSTLGAADAVLAGAMADARL